MSIYISIEYPLLNLHIHTYIQTYIEYILHYTYISTFKYILFKYKYIYNKGDLHGGKTTMLYLNLSGH